MKKPSDPQNTLGWLYGGSIAIPLIVSLLFTNLANTLLVAAFALFLPVLIKLIRTKFQFERWTWIDVLQVVAIIAFAAAPGLLNPPPYVSTVGTELNCEQYQLRLAFDPSHNTFSGSQKIQLVLEIDNEDDLKKFSRGQPILYDNSNRFMRSLSREGFAGWAVTNVKIGDRDDRGKRKATIELSLNSVDVKTSKQGLLRYVSEIKTPPAVKGRSQDAPPKVEIILEAPKNSYVTHNLNGSFSDNVVLGNNEEGRRLVADRVFDVENTIRLSFAPSSFQNEPLHKLLEITWWKLILLIWAILVFVVSLILAIVTDVIKDSVKPFVVRVLTWLVRVIKKLKGGSSPPGGSR